MKSYDILLNRSFLVLLLLNLVGCKAKNAAQLGTSSELESTDEADGLGNTLDPLFACRPQYVGATVQSSRFAYYLSTDIRGIAGVPARRGVKVSILDVINYYKKTDSPAKELSWYTYNILLDLGGEGKFNAHGIKSGSCRAVNVNKQTTNSQNGEVIPALVQIQDWEDGYPFVNDFATTIMMQGAPLTPKNISEIARILKHGGVAILDMGMDVEAQVEELKKKLGCFDHGSFSKAPVQGGVYTRFRCRKMTHQAPDRVIHDDLL